MDTGDNKPIQSQASEMISQIDPGMPKVPKRSGGARIIIFAAAILLGLAGLGWFVWQKQRPAPVPIITSSFKKTGYDDACALVSKADVEGAFDKKFETFTKDKVRAGLTPESSSCTINEAHERTAKGALEFTSLQIAVDKFDTEEIAQHKLDVMRRSVVIDGKVLDVVTEVPGLGDEAFFSKNQISGSTQEYLFVRKGVRLFHFIAVKFNGIDSEKVRPQLIEIAKKAVK